MDENNTTPKEAEELESEQENQAEVTEDDIRAKIITEYGFDEDDDADKIEKAVAIQKKHHEKLSQVIRQKAKYRNEYEKLKGSTPKAEPSTPKANDEDLDQKITERLDREYLEDLEYPDDLKKIIKRTAEIEGISVKKAVKDPYVASKIESWQKTQNAEEAALTRTNKTGGRTTGDENDLYNPPEFDMTTEKGRKAYDEWKEKAIAKEMKQRRG